MPLPWGPGPVFVHESIAAARRWQSYALRSLFVLGLLIGLALVWVLLGMQDGEPADNLPIKLLASLGQYFYLAIATTQLALVLTVAPAATAGAICLDRARGSLTHMMVTDLADSEIVLGKLAARLAPVLALVAATVPVLALAGLLGGVIIEAIVSLTLITLALAVFGCALAMAFSVRAKKTHEVLMAVYVIEAAWVLGPGIWESLASPGIFPGPPDWFMRINPFVLAWAPYAWPKYVGPEWLAMVLGGMMLISAGLVAYTVLRLRAEVTNQSGARVGRLSAWLGRLQMRASAWRPGPSLDDDPVLWREWRRSRPTRLARIVWGLFIAASLAGTGWGIITVSYDHRRGSTFLELVGGLEATFGLMLVSLAAPTLLAEERVRGGLDVLMATPLSTDRIVLSKWWGIYRVVPALVLLPAIGAIWLAAAGEPEVAAGIGRIRQAPPAPFSPIDRFACAGLPIATLLVQGAAVTSVGLALATWMRRLGRTVALSVAGYIFFAFGWIVFLEMGILTGPLRWFGLIAPNDHETETFVAMVLGSACPLGGQMFTPIRINYPDAGSRVAFYIGQVGVILAMLLFTMVVLALTMATFNRCMGRMPERPRRAPRPPRRADGPRGPHVRAADLRRSGVAR